MDLTMLFEMDWYDRSPLTAVLQRNRGRWIHFSQGAPNRNWQQVTLLPEPTKPGSYDYRTNRRYQRELTAVKRKNAIHRVPKLGINPKSSWQDPKGVYFYPVDWLLSGHERVVAGQQFAIHYPYYYIVDLNLNDPNGIDLGTITWEQIAAIAQRNGWFEPMQEFRALPIEQQRKVMNMDYSRPDVPGSFFWHFIDRMVKDGKLTWGKAYRGVSFIRDPDLGIISGTNKEPNQVLVLNPRLIKVIEAGENKNPITSGEGSDSLAQWMHSLVAIIKRVRGEYGGDLTWNKKRPMLTFTKGRGRFALAVPERSSFFGEVGLTLNYSYGRASNGMHIAYKDLLASNSQQIIDKINTRVETVAARKTDLMFKPILDIETGKRLLLSQMADNLDLSIKTAIENAESVENRGYNTVSLHGEVQRELGRLPVKTSCALRLHEDHMDGSANLWVGRHHLISASSLYSEQFREPIAMMDSIAAKARENFDGMMREFGPRPAGVNSYYDRHPRFSTSAETTAAIGWIIANSGLSFGGALRRAFADEIAAFEAYPDQQAMVGEITYIMNSKY